MQSRWSLAFFSSSALRKVAFGLLVVHWRDVLVAKRLFSSAAFARRPAGRHTNARRLRLSRNASEFTGCYKSGQHLSMTFSQKHPARRCHPRRVPLPPERPRLRRVPRSLAVFFRRCVFAGSATAACDLLSTCCPT